MKRPNPAPVLDLIEAFRRSQTMFAACELGVFDLLADGPRTAKSLAEETGSAAEPLARLLEAAVSLGLLDADGEGAFSNTPHAAAYLATASPQSLAGYIRYSNRVLYPMWGRLEDAVREGGNRWQQTFGLSSAALFESFYDTDESMKTFLLGMHGFGMQSSPAVVAAFDLSRFQRIADLGGATGHLAVAACERYAEMRGVVFDLPRVIGFAREINGPVRVAGRLRFTEGDFFADRLPAADLYGLGRILHDWSEEKIGRLLKKIHAALPDGGALLVAEKLLDEDRRGPVPVHMQSLNMLICTEGRERTLSEYRALLEAAGFSQVDGRVTGTPLDVVLAIK